MIDKLVLTTNSKLSIIYTDKTAVTIISDQGEALALYSWLHTPTVIRFSDYQRAVDNAEEQTLKISKVA